MSQPQRILHLLAELDGYGPTRQLELLATAQRAEGHQPRVLALAAKRDPLNRLRQLDIECRVCDRRWRRDPFAALRLAGELRRCPPDILHAWDGTARRYVSVVRRFGGGGVLAAGTPLLAPLVAPGIGPAQTPVQSRQEFLDEQQLPPDSILIAVAGPLTRQQQIDEAIWNFELVRTMEERTRLLIFGDGPDRHRLERFARLTSEPHAIRFLGYRTDFRELVAYADVFWQTHVADVPLPLTVLEAMAAQVPVVANDGPGCRRIITDGVNGYLVPDKDRAAFARQTLQVIRDPQLARQLGTAAASTVAEHFSLASMVEAYAECYAASLVSS